MTDRYAALSPEQTGPLAVSIIIPTYDKAYVLEKSLQSLGQQSLPQERFETIVVDDGSTDDTAAVVTRWGQSRNCRLLRQRHNGPAAARNLGAAEAHADIVLFLDDDVIASPQVVEEHLRVHRETDLLLALGRRRPWAEAYSTQFDRILDYESVLDLGDRSRYVPFHAATSQNLSIRRARFLALGGFDEGFPGAAVEDTEFAYRAVTSGIKIWYNANAVTYHNHPRTLAERCAQLRWYSRWTPMLYQKHPELRGQIPAYRDKEPIRWGHDPPGLIGRKALRRVLATWPARFLTQAVIRLLEGLRPSPQPLRFLYWQLLNSYRVVGFREGLHGLARTGLQRHCHTG